MLSLVNYGSSGESEDEDNNSDVVTSSSNPAETADENTKTVIEDLKHLNDDEFEGKKTNGPAPVKPQESSSEDSLLSHLPPPVTDLRSIPWDQLSKLTYKSRAIRIMAPSIPEEVEEKKEKKLPSKTGSGLLAMLPKPRNEFLATPNVLRPSSVAKKPTPSKAKPLPKPKLAAAKKADEHDSDTDEEDEKIKDFFSLSKPSEESKIAPVDLDFTFPSSNTSSDSSHKVNYLQPPEEAKTTPIHPPPVDSYCIDTTGEINKQVNASSHDYVPFQQSSDELQLDSEALAALCGSRGLKRRGGNDDEFKIIDINGSHLTPDAQELLAKNLTSEQPRPKKHNKDGPTSQQKRKHQIIYLAHQAKEQELELQNTWSNNRMSKKQTQAKYGF